MAVITETDTGTLQIFVWNKKFSRNWDLLTPLPSVYAKMESIIRIRVPPPPHQSKIDSLTHVKR